MITLIDIQPNPDNPRFIQDEKFDKLKASIEQFPKMMTLRPIVVDGSGMVLGGNMRLRALQELGYKEIPEEWVKCADELTEDEKRRFIITDNADFGQWDWDVLANEWNAEELNEWGLDVPEEWGEEIAPQEDGYEPLQDIETDILAVDIFEITAGDITHRLACGDSLDITHLENLVAGQKVGMVFTDPDFSMPYDDVAACFDNCLTLCHGVQFWILADKQAVKLSAHAFDVFGHFFVHDFRNATMISGSQPMSRTTLIAKFGKGKMNNLGDGFSTLISIATERVSSTHKDTPMSKEVELPFEFIAHYSQPGDVVLDIFGHSGSTLMAAHQLGRCCFINELEPKYCQYIINRLCEFDPGIKVQKVAQSADIQ